MPVVALMMEASHGAAGIHKNRLWLRWRMAAARASAAARESTAHRSHRRGCEACGPWTVALTARLRELGWGEGDTVAIEYRWAQGRSDRVSEFAAEFERRKVDVIV